MAKRKKISAFTLIEVLLALVVLGVGMTALFSLFAVGTHSVRRAVALTQASLIAQLTMEYYCYTGYYTGMETNPPTVPTSYVSEYAHYTRTVSAPQTVIANKLFRVDVNVDGNGANEDFSTYIAQY